MLCNDCHINPRIKNRRICNQCKYARAKESNPIGLAYSGLKASAKRRGHEFTLTFEYFKEFCIKHEYIDKKGRHREGYGVDRIRENEGYIEGNIQVLSNVDNIKKYREYIGTGVDGKKKFTTVTVKPTINNQEEYVDDDLPF